VVIVDGAVGPVVAQDVPLVISVTRGQLPRDVPAGAVFLCDVAAILGDTIKETLCICRLALFMHAGCLEGEGEFRITKFQWNSLNRRDHLHDLDVDGDVLVCSSDCI